MALAVLCLVAGLAGCSSDANDSVDQAATTSACEAVPGLLQDFRASQAFLDPDPEPAESLAGLANDRVPTDVKAPMEAVAAAMQSVMLEEFGTEGHLRATLELRRVSAALALACLDHIDLSAPDTMLGRWYGIT